MFFIYTVLGLLLLGFGNFLILKFKKDKRSGRKFYDFNDGNFIVYAVLLLIISFIAVNFALNEPQFSDINAQLEYGKKTTQPWLVSQAYHARIEKDGSNIDDHFHFVDMHFNKFQNQGPDYKKYNKEGAFIYFHYTNLSESNDAAKADIGNLFLGMYYYKMEDFPHAQHHFEQVQNRKLKYLNNFAGMVNYFYGRRIEAKENLR